ncbi:MAG: hypothetical protein WAX69_07280 [Victivallales bacterium]
MTKRKMLEGKQVGGMFLSPEWIVNPKLAQPWIKQIADMGYSSAIIFVRHQKRTVLEREVHDAVKVIVHMGHEQGLRILLDTDHAWWGPVFVEAHPETALWAIRSVKTTVTDGKFECRCIFPEMPGQRIVHSIIAAFMPTANGGYRYAPGKRLVFAATPLIAQAEGTMLKGRWPTRYTGKVVLYVVVQTMGLVDVAHPLYLKAQEELLDAYRDIPLDGFTWDEPGKGMSDLTCFKAGIGFMRLFQQVNGYELAGRLIYLDHLDGSPEAVKVRCDYQRTLIEMNYRAQAQHNAHARQISKRDLMFGTHQTWSGLPADLAAGVIDYFKLGKVLTGVWTDGGCDVLEPKFMFFNYLLAEGLKKELGQRDAYYNDWSMWYRPAGALRFFNHVKMLFHINWFNHCLSPYSEGLANFQSEPLRSTATEDTQALDQFDRMVGDTCAPHTDVAMLYTWETMAAAPRWLIRLTYTCYANTSLQLADSGQYAALMSGPNLLHAKPVKGGFKVNGFTYRVLVVPYASVLPMAVYTKVMALCDAGVPVIFLGPPPEFAAETGASLAMDFARRLGIRPLTFAQYASALAEQDAVPAANDWEPGWLDATCPVVSTGARTFPDVDGHLAYVQAKSRPMYYIPAPDPREMLTTLLSSLIRPPVDVFADNAYWRWYPNRQDASHGVFVAVSKGQASLMSMPGKGDARPSFNPHPMKVLAGIGRGTLRLGGGTWCAVRIVDNHIAESIGDCPEILWGKSHLTKLEER